MPKASDLTAIDFEAGESNGATHGAVAVHIGRQRRPNKAKKLDASRGLGDCEFAFVQYYHRRVFGHFGVLFGVKGAKKRRVIKEFSDIVIWCHGYFRRFYE